MIRSWLLICTLFAGTLQAETPEWQPARTWVFAVGVLQFDSPTLQTYPEEGRVDAVMLEALKKRGVPESQIVFIKNEQATEKHIASEFEKLLKKTAEGDTLLFYYTGHGGRDYSEPTRPVNFITYDTGSKWMVSEMLDAIESRFQGSLALLVADCCHSGGLAEEAARRSQKIGYGVLASAQPASVSTSNWTFTQCLANLFNGHAALDLNRDGRILFEEAAEYCDAEMSFCEDQRACHVALGRFRPDLVMATAQKQTPPRVGEHCEALSRGIWMKGKIIDAKEGKLLIDWVDRPAKRDAWVEPDLVRKPETTAMEIGQRVQIEWNGVWYKGKVLQARGGLHLVHYEGFPSTDDEWTPLKRLRPQP